MPQMTMTPEQLANLPLLPNPQGLPPNFDHPDSNGQQAIAACSVFIAIATVAVSLRMISRVKVVKRTGLDDWASVAALLSSAASAAFFFWLLCRKILGPHAWDVRLESYLKPEVARLLFGIQITGNLANFFAKASILLFIQRLFPRHVSPKTAYAIWIGLIINTVAYFVLTIYLFAKCTPENGAFPEKCPGSVLTSLGVISAVINAFLDLYALGVAIPALWMLQMPLRRRVSVVAVLGLGLVACGLSLATLGKRITNDPTLDPTRTQVVMILLGVMEPLLATTTACLPAMPALWAEFSTKGAASLKRLLSRVRSTVSISSKTASQYNGIDDGHSMKSLNSHGLSHPHDVERGDSKIQVRTTLTSTTTPRERSVRDLYE